LSSTAEVIILTVISDDFVEHYVQSTSLEMRSDLLEIIEMMKSIAPDAELTSDLGIPYFQLDSSWLYGVAAREDHLHVYFSDLSLLHAFEKRLRHAQFGNNCLIIHRLSDINRNVFVELLGQMKVHFDNSIEKIKR